MSAPHLGYYALKPTAGSLAYPASTSAWQFAQRSTHFFASSRMIANDLVSPWPLSPKDF